jgi:hypothetical protein
VQLVLLNNDVVVADGWLGQPLVRVFAIAAVVVGDTRDHGIGLSVRLQIGAEM